MRPLPLSLPQPHRRSDNQGQEEDLLLAAVAAERMIVFAAVHKECNPPTQGSRLQKGFRSEERTSRTPVMLFDSCSTLRADCPEYRRLMLVSMRARLGTTTSAGWNPLLGDMLLAQVSVIQTAYFPVGALSAVLDTQVGRRSLAFVPLPHTSHRVRTTLPVQSTAMPQDWLSCSAAYSSSPSASASPLASDASSRPSSRTAPSLLWPCGGL